MVNPLSRDAPEVEGLRVPREEPECTPQRATLEKTGNEQREPTETTFTIPLVNPRRPILGPRPRSICRRTGKTS